MIFETGVFNGIFFGLLPGFLRFFYGVSMVSSQAGGTSDL